MVVDHSWFLISETLNLKITIFAHSKVITRYRGSQIKVNEIIARYHGPQIKVGEDW